MWTCSRLAEHRCTRLCPRFHMPYWLLQCFYCQHDLERHSHVSLPACRFMAGDRRSQAILSLILIIENLAIPVRRIHHRITSFKVYTSPHQHTSPTFSNTISGTHQYSSQSPSSPTPAHSNHSSLCRQSPPHGPLADGSPIAFH